MRYYGILSDQLFRKLKEIYPDLNPNKFFEFINDGIVDRIKKMHAPVRQFAFLTFAFPNNCQRISEEIAAAAGLTAFIQGTTVTPPGMLLPYDSQV